MEISRDIIEKAQAGEREALKQIYEKYRDFVWNTVWWMFKDKDVLEDVVQEIFLRIFGKIRSFRFTSDLRTWIYRLSTNFAINFARKRERHQTASLDERIGNDDIGEVQIETLEERDLQERIFSRLKPDSRAILILREVEGMSYEEIAQVLRIPVGTVRSRLSRAREEVIEILQKLGV